MMMHRVTWMKKRSLSLILVVALAAAMAVLTWFSVQAEDGPGAPAGGQAALEADETTFSTVQSTEAMTAYLPFVTRNYPRLSSLFGVQMSKITRSGGLVEALDAKIVWVRYGTFHWDQVEPVRTNPPTYNWGPVDEDSLRNAEKYGLEVVAVINLAPDWALQTPGPHCGPIAQNALGAFGEFVNAVVTRYSKPPFNVRYWELGNEPDIDPSLLVNADPEAGYGCWGDVNDPYYGGRYYAEMLKVAYPAIKAADPRAKVVLGGLLLDCDPRDPAACAQAAHGSLPPRFLEGILLNDGGKYFDIAGFHTYSYYAPLDGLGNMGTPKWPGSETVVPEKVSFVRGVLAQYGYGDKPLMNTEAALLCYDDWLPQGCREQQAIFVPRAYADAMAMGLEAQLYFGMINDRWFNTGLLADDLTPRPPYHTYVVASQYLSPATYVGKARGYPAGIAGYEFADSSGRLDLIWSADGTARSVLLPSGVSAYDRYGKLIASGATIRVDYGPVWVTR